MCARFKFVGCQLFVFFSTGRDSGGREGVAGRQLGWNVAFASPYMYGGNFFIFILLYIFYNTVLIQAVIQGWAQPH